MGMNVYVFVYIIMILFVCMCDVPLCFVIPILFNYKFMLLSSFFAGGDGIKIIMRFFGWCSCEASDIF